MSERRKEGESRREKSASRELTQTGMTVVNDHFGSQRASGVVVDTAGTCKSQQSELVLGS